MPQDDDWSDSDDEVFSDSETPVQLGLPDGPIHSSTDLLDAAVSRIGGHPAFLTQEPPVHCAHCAHCSNQMELLLQVWCPLEDSPNDRALYIWGCARTGCQKKAGSVRAWRGLKRNPKYAAKLERKRARQQQREDARAKELAAQHARAAAAKVNPFSMKGSSAPTSSPFGLGAQVFGAPASADAPSAPESEELAAGESSEPSSDEEESDEDEELLTAMASTTLEDSHWKDAPAYPPVYLSTSAEYLPPEPKTRGSQEEALLDEAADGKSKEAAGWGLEGYENSMDLDHVFERFMRRVGFQGEQCIRYELGGTPLPYAGDAVFDKLFPVPSSPYVSVTKGAFTAAAPPKRTYNAASVPACPSCKSKRVFECQLMPNLISVLEKSPAGKPANAKPSQTDEERRKEIEHALKGTGPSDARGMQWGTCLIFSCEKDCCLDGSSEAASAWREEVVFVQWDV